MIKRCGKCGRVTSTTLKFTVEEEEKELTLCKGCKWEFTRKLDTLIKEYAQTKEVKVVKSFSY